jgi:hypothetical protein
MALQKERSSVTVDPAAQGEALPREVRTVAARDADETLGLEQEFNSEAAAPPTAKESRRLNRKLYINLILLVCVIDLMLFVSYSFPRQ